MMFDSRKLLDELMGAGAAAKAPGSGDLESAISQIAGDFKTGMRQGAANEKVTGGGFASVIGAVLGQAASGLKDAAREVEARTGIAGKANEAVKEATGGRAVGDLLAQARELASQNKLATGAAIGGLAAILLGAGAGRGLAATTVKLGGLAAIGGLAYKAYQNYLAGKPLIDVSGLEAAPQESPFGNTADAEQDKRTALLIIRAMIASASADGVVDNAERRHIVGGLEKAGLDVNAAKFLDQEFAHPASVDDLVAATSTPETAAQVYTAARLAADPDQPAEQQFLTRLAAGLNLAPELVNNIETVTRNTSQQS
jgi:uncharacterized membrane protein YebE (DUF533 family)